MYKICWDNNAYPIPSTQLLLLILILLPLRNCNVTLPSFMTFKAMHVKLDSVLMLIHVVLLPSVIPPKLYFLMI